MATAITLAGVPIYPSDIQHKLVKIGKVLVAANGGRTFLHRTSSGTPIFKNTWDLSFQSVTETRRAALRGIAALTTTMAFLDEHGTTYTVQVEEDAYEDSIAIIAKPSALNLYYNVKLTIWEA